MNRSRPLVFLFATLMEARPLIELTHAELISARANMTYRTALGGCPALILICGMGMQAAERVTRDAIETYRPSGIVNAGAAGGLRGHLTVGDIRNIALSRVLSSETHDVCSLPVQAQPVPGHAGASLLTLNRPVFDADQRQALSAFADLVDMEGGAIARVCQAHAVPCQLLKVVSDFAEQRAQLHRNLHRVCTQLALQIVGGFNHALSPSHEPLSYSQVSL